MISEQENQLVSKNNELTEQLEEKEEFISFLIAENEKLKLGKGKESIENTDKITEGLDETLLSSLDTSKLAYDEMIEAFRKVKDKYSNKEVLLIRY